MARIDPEELRTACESIVEGMGASPSIATDVVDHLVNADLRGHGSHGVRMLPIYQGFAEEGILEPGATPTTESTVPGCARVDGRRGFGQVAGLAAVERGIELAEDGIAVVGVGNTTHVGRIGEYGERAAAADRLFAAFVNVPAEAGQGSVAPLGSTSGRLGTNPLCFAFPAYGALPDPVVMDMATSQVAIGKIRRAVASGDPLEPEWTVSSSGEPVADAETFVGGEGAILPAGGRTTGHKGFGLSIVAELFAANLGDGYIAGQSDFPWGNTAAFFFADPTAFSTREAIEARLRALADHIADAEYSEAVAAGPSTRSDRGVLPGWPEVRTAEENRRDGVPVPEADLADLGRLADDLGVGDAVPAGWRAD